MIISNFKLILGHEYFEIIIQIKWFVRFIRKETIPSNKEKCKLMKRSPTQ